MSASSKPQSANRDSDNKTLDSVDIFEEQKDRQHQSKLSNGLPLSIFFLLLVAIGWGFEFNLSGQKQSGVSISLAPLSKETVESESVESVKLLKTEQIDGLSLALFQLIIDNNWSLEKINNAEILSELERLEKDSVIYFSIKMLSKQKYYLVADKLLNEMGLALRQSRGLQFTKAFVENKLGDTQSAIQSYQILLRTQPNNQSAIINLGYLYLEKQQLDEAEKHFSAAVSSMSGSKKAKVLVGLANSIYRQKRYQESIPIYQKAIEYRPSHALTWRSLAKASAAAFNDHNLSVDSYNKAIALDKNNVEIYVEYSAYLIKTLNYRKAITQLKRAKKLARNRFSIRFWLVFCYAQLDKPINASKQLSLASKIVRRSGDKLRIEAMQKYLAKDYRLSINLFKGLLKRNRDNFIEYYLIAKNYSQLNKTKSAKVYLDKITENSNLTYAAKLLQASNFMRVKKYPLAVAIYSELSQRLMDNSELYYKLALGSEKMGNYPMAVSALNSAIEIHPKNKYKLRYADLQWLMGNRQQSLKLLQRLLKDKPNYLRAIFHLADYNQQMGNFDQAIDQYVNLLSYRSNYSDAQYRLASLYVDKGLFEQSMPLLRGYLDKKSNSKPARLLIARVFCELGQLDSCKEQLQLVLRLDPTYQPALDYKAVISEKYPNNS